MSVSPATQLFEAGTPQGTVPLTRFDTVAACLNAVFAAHCASLGDHVGDHGGTAQGSGRVMVLSGDANAALGLDLLPKIVTAPRAENGWYSKTHLGQGAPSVEIVAPIDVPSCPKRVIQEMERSRADALVRLGDADRVLSTTDESPPKLELPLAKHHSHRGLDFGFVHDVVQSAEWPLKCDIGAPYTQRALRIHIFDPVASVDMIHVWCDLHRDACATGYLVSLRTWIKPAGGTPVLAFAERILRVVGSR